MIATVYRLFGTFWGLLLWAGLLFIPFLGGMALFDWDEINFAECAREMLVSGQYLTVTIDFQTFWEKPPLFIALQAGMMSLFGVNEFSARLPNALCGILTVGLLFQIGKRMYGTSFGRWWALIYMGTVLPHLYFRSGIIDPLFNLLIFLSLYLWFESNRLRKNKIPASVSRSFVLGVLGSALLMGLAMLTKGPVALLLALLTLITVGILGLKRDHNKTTKADRFPFLGFCWWILGAGILFLMWFGLDYLKNGACSGHDFSGVRPESVIPLLRVLPCTMAEFIAYHLRLATTEDAGHGGFFGYHLVVLALGCFPAFIFSAKYLFRLPERDATRWLWVLFWVVVVVFSMVKTKIVHYSSLAYFPLTFFAARQVSELVSGNASWKKMYTVYLSVIGGLVGLVLTGLPVAISFKDAFIPLIKDPFARANLSASVDWSFYHVWVGIGWLAVIVATLYFIFQKGQILRAMNVLWVGMSVAIASVIYVIVPRVEPYTQGAPIAFFKSLKGKAAYVATLHYKSYAPYFYAEVPHHANPKYYAPEREKWLTEGDIDLPAYFSVKINRAEEYRTEKYRALGWSEIGERNGFAFFKRERTSR